MRDNEQDEKLTPEEEASRRAALGLDLPVIIKAPGIYETRCGERAVIHKITDAARDPYNCKGSVLHRAHGVKTTTVPCMWTNTGRFRAGGEHADDIVGRPGHANRS